MNEQNVGKPMTATEAIERWNSYSGPEHELLLEARQALWEAHKKIHGAEVFKLRPDLCAMCKTLVRIDAAIGTPQGKDTKGQREKV